MEILSQSCVCVRVCVSVSKAVAFIYLFIYLYTPAPSVLRDRFTHLSWGGLHSQFRHERRQATAVAPAPCLCDTTTVNLTSLDV